MNDVRIALLGTHGLPARHGAFEQAVFKITEWAAVHRPWLQFFVGCDARLAGEAFEAPGVRRLFAPRRKGLGVILYDLETTAKAVAAGCRHLIYFGYEFAPFFPLLRLLGLNVICNVDGIEWRRAKWGKVAKAYFRFCELMTVKFANKLIYDAHGIRRYYLINHGRDGELIFYGFDESGLKSPEAAEKSNYYICVMRMEPENNILPIVKGFAQARTDKTLLVVGPSTDFFERECRPFVDGVKVNYMGPIYDRDRLIALRKGAFGYIHGHSVGGTNPTLIEAIGLGNRVIALNSIFNQEVCGPAARYFRNADQLAEVIEGGGLREPPVLGAEYTWDYVAARYLDLVDQSDRSKATISGR